MTKRMRCRDCAGQGVIILYGNTEDGPMVVQTYTCVECRGEGYALAAA
jgi:DnaJ-class molecular chaperone